MRNKHVLSDFVSLHPLPGNLGWTWYLVESMWLWTQYAQTHLGTKPPVIAFLSALEVRQLAAQRPPLLQSDECTGTYTHT